MLKDVTKKELAKDACKIDLMRRIPRYIIYLVMIAICSICANTFDTAVVKTLMMAFIMLFIFFIQNIHIFWQITCIWKMIAIKIFC